MKGLKVDTCVSSAVVNVVSPAAAARGPTASRPVPTGHADCDQPTPQLLCGEAGFTQVAAIPIKVNFDPVANPTAGFTVE